MASQNCVWQASECAMKKYPMRMMQGALFLPDGEAVPFLDSRVICNGWGEVGSLRLETDEPRALPVSLSVEWYSYAEDAFFSGDFELPTDKLQQLFADGYPDPVTGERRDYEFILVGLALEGCVSLWVVGGGTTLEVADFTTARVDKSFASVFGTDVEKTVYVEEAVEFLQETAGLTGETIGQPIPKDYWKRCHERFRTRVLFGGGDNSQLWLKTTDGQCQFFDSEEPTVTEKNLARIESGFLFWESMDERSWRAEFSMDEDEVLWAYDRLKKLAPSAPLILEIELGNKYPAVHVSLKADKWLIPMKPIVHSIANG